MRLHRSGNAVGMDFRTVEASVGVIGDDDILWNKKDALLAVDVTTATALLLYEGLKEALGAE